MKLTTSYDKFLLSRNTIYIPDTKLPNGKFASTKSGTIAIPPCNADIRVAQFAAPLSTAAIGKFRAEATKLPETWNWRDLHSTDDKVKKYIKKNKLLTPVLNQGKCGSCWAISTASNISDQFVINKRLKHNPQISYTFALKNDTVGAKCSGGNPTQLV
jgi:hypothetical protein